MKTSLAFCLLFFAACSAAVSSSEHDTGFENTLMAIADEVRASATPAQVRFADLTSHPWDRVYIFGAYHPWDAIEAKLGSRWRPQGGVGFQQMQDGHVVVVFMKDGRVTHHSNLSPLHGDFGTCGKKSEDGYTPETAVFELREKKLGDEPWLMFSEADERGFRFREAPAPVP